LPPPAYREGDTRDQGLIRRVVDHGADLRAVVEGEETWNDGAQQQVERTDDVERGLADKRIRREAARGDAPRGQRVWKREADRGVAVGIGDEGRVPVRGIGKAGAQPGRGAAGSACAAAPAGPRRARGELRSVLFALGRVRGCRAG